MLNIITSIANLMYKSLVGYILGGVVGFYMANLFGMNFYNSRSRTNKLFKKILLNKMNINNNDFSDGSLMVWTGAIGGICIGIYSWTIMS